MPFVRTLYQLCPSRVTKDTKEKWLTKSKTQGGQEDFKLFESYFFTLAIFTWGYWGVISSFKSIFSDSWLFTPPSPPAPSSNKIHDTYTYWSLDRQLWQTVNPIHDLRAPTHHGLTQSRILLYLIVNCTVVDCCELCTDEPEIISLCCIASYCNFLFCVIPLYQIVFFRIAESRLEILTQPNFQSYSLTTLLTAMVWLPVS